MDINIYRILFVLLCNTLTTIEHDTSLHDYCIDDGFNAECLPGEKLIMQEAVYGRMEFGTCLQYAMGVLCKSDVMHYMDAWCSGQQTCQVNIRRFTMLTNDCPAELNGYLRARYTCLRVTTFGEQCCHAPEKHVYVPLNTEYVASSLVPEAECGTQHCSLVIQASTGQQINISIYNFNISSTAIRDISNFDEERRSSRCFVYANIKEEGIGITAALCVDDVSRRHLYTSSTNEVEIQVDIQEEADASQFVFKFEAIGCPDPVLPANAYVERDGQHATIRCEEFDDKMWQITCNDIEWTGDIGNCTLDISNYIENDIQPENEVRFPKVVAIAVILTFAVLISTGIILIGVACVRRHKRKTERSLRQQPPPRDTVHTYTRNSQSCQTLDQHSSKNVHDFEISYPQPILQRHGYRMNVPMDTGSYRSHTSDEIK